MNPSCSAHLKTGQTSKGSFGGVPPMTDCQSNDGSTHVALKSDDRKLRVLIVENDRDTAETTAILLGMAGHEVKIALDGSEAERLAQEVLPEALLIDIGMPGQDGYQVAKRLRGMFPKKPLLVAVTGYGQQSDYEHSQQEGFDLHLVKPVDPAVLLKILGDYARSL
jgi:CheY-like chemotaxis protein